MNKREIIDSFSVLYSRRKISEKRQRDPIKWELKKETNCHDQFSANSKNILCKLKSDQFCDTQDRQEKKGSPQSIIRFAEHVPNTDRNEHLVITGAKLYKYMQTELKFITRQNVSQILVPDDSLNNRIILCSSSGRISVRTWHLCAARGDRCPTFY